ncbi:hypothetical protein KR51_00036290, partial [Rubidibacter lacunae KORDI 51-2]
MDGCSIAANLAGCGGDRSESDILPTLML